MSKNKNDVVIVELDRPRELRFGHKALKKLSALSGKGMEDLSEEDFDLEELEQIFFYGLERDARENGEMLKMEDMEDILDCAPDYGYLMEKMQAAMANAMGGISGKPAIAGADVGTEQSEPPSEWNWEESLKAAIHAGISLRDYNDMTPYELNLYLYDYAEKSKKQAENDLVTAYLTAYYHRVNRMPNLKEQIEKLKPKKRQTDEEMAVELAKFAAFQNGAIPDGSG